MLSTIYILMIFWTEPGGVVKRDQVEVVGGYSECLEAKKVWLKGQRELMIKEAEAFCIVKSN